MGTKISCFSSFRNRQAALPSMVLIALSTIKFSSSFLLATDPKALLIVQKVLK